MDKSSKYYAYAEELFVILKPSLDNFSQENIVKYVEVLRKYL